LVGRYESANAAKEPCQREGAEACSALMVDFLARLPATFEADEQTDGQRDGQATEQLFLIHLLYIPQGAACPRCRRLTSDIGPT